MNSQTLLRGCPWGQHRWPCSSPHGGPPAPTMPLNSGWSRHSAEGFSQPVAPLSHHTTSHHITVNSCWLTVRFMYPKLTQKLGLCYVYFTLLMWFRKWQIRKMSVKMPVCITATVKVPTCSNSCDVLDDKVAVKSVPYGASFFFLRKSTWEFKRKQSVCFSSILITAWNQHVLKSMQSSVDENQCEGLHT